MRRPRGQLLWALGRTEARPYHTNRLGRLSLLAGATGSAQCEKTRNPGKLFLSEEHQPISLNHTRCYKAEGPYCIVEWLGDQMHCTPLRQVQRTTPRQEANSPNIFWICSTGWRRTKSTGTCIHRYFMGPHNTKMAPMVELLLAEQQQTCAQRQYIVTWATKG